MAVVALDDGHEWLRLVDPGWPDPLDATFSTIRGGRWTEPGGPATLHLNADVATARANVVRFLADGPIAPEDLNDTGGYALVTVALPDRQQALDAVTDAGLTDVGLPTTYPLDADGTEVPRTTCQPVGGHAYAEGLDGVYCRSAAGSGAELAWFPRGRAPVAGPAAVFSAWYFPTA